MGIGVLAAMTGISGGAFKTPILIILFALGAELAVASSLFSALFVAIASSLGYYRHNPQLIEFRIGTLAVVATIPGSFVGIWIRTIVVHAHLLQIIFGIVLIPVAVKMMLARPDDKEHDNGEKKLRDFSQLNWRRRVIAVAAIFLAGVSAGLLGLGGGTIIVPTLCIVLGFSMIKAAATSMYIMIYTSTAGSLINYQILAPTPDFTIFLYFGLAMGVGMIIGGPIGTKYASRIDSAWLQRLFGFLLVFPLVKMMRLGQLWLDPSGSNYVIATIGDAIIWLVVGLPIWVLSSYRIKTDQRAIVSQPTPE